MPRPTFIDKRKMIKQIIRVDHAGEYGAKVIYQGQLSYNLIKDQTARDKLTHMLAEEQEHLDYFSNQINQREIAPTFFLPLWHLGGYMLGLCSAVFGFKATMLATESIEEVIEEHYREQLDLLKDNPSEADLYSQIKKFQTAEIEHKNEAISNGSKKVMLYGLWSNLIKTICKNAIYLSKKL
jgi:ubiquinone biosynthesis monooxygenase Coq7